MKVLRLIKPELEAWLTATGGGGQEQHIKDVGGGEIWRVQAGGDEGPAGREALLLFGNKAVTRFLLAGSGPLRAARRSGVGLAQIRAVCEVAGLDRLVSIAAAAAQRAAQVASQVPPRRPAR